MTTPLPLTPLTPRVRRSSQIADELRRLITTGQLKPGDRLPTEEALCKQFGASRTTLREAIQTMRTTGLLDVTPGRGSFIRTPDIRQLMADVVLAGRCAINNAAEVVAMRLLMQKHVLSGLAKVPSAKRKELYQFVLARTSAPEENAATEAAWHLHMASLAGNTLMHIMLDTLLHLTEEPRIKAYRDPDAVMRAIHLQMRFNAAVADADWPLAERVLTQMIDPSAQQSVSMPALPATANA